jgi:GT2 family glycosyltransferase
VVSASVPLLPHGVLAEAHYGDCDGECRRRGQAAATTGVAVVVCTRNRPDLLAGFLESLTAQEPRPAQLVIVDASIDDRSARVLDDHAMRCELARCVRYTRVDETLSGLTRQRNLALTQVTTDLMASFDDDIVLAPGCLTAMERPLRDHADIVGVGACIDNCSADVSLRWRLRRLLLVVPSLEGGRYFSSGIATPWRYVAPSAGMVEGDWLPGGAVMWRADAARSVGYAERLDGYGRAEDVEFSLRMGRLGRQVLARQARLLHLMAGDGRPDPRRLGFETLRNLLYIRRVAAEAGRANRIWFGYAMTMETLIEALNLLRPGMRRRTMAYLLGIFDCVRQGLGRGAHVRRSHPSPATGGQP